MKCGGTRASAGPRAVTGEHSTRPPSASGAHSRRFVPIDVPITVPTNVSVKVPITPSARAGERAH
jgi:hypothetical protein